MPDTLEQLMRLPYTVSMREDAWEDGVAGWFAWVEELPGCFAQGASPADAHVQIRSAMRAWIEAALEDGIDVPQPMGEHSGQYMLRLPRSLHAELARRAKVEGVSLNQFTVAALAGAVGWRAQGSRPDAA